MVISKEMIEACGFHLVHEFNRSTFKNMVTLHGILNNTPKLVKRNGDTILYGNINLEIHQVDGLDSSFVLTVCRMVRRKYGRKFYQENETLIPVQRFTDINEVKTIVHEKIISFCKSNRA